MSEPECEEVWVPGEILPADYQGCRRGASSFHDLVPGGTCKLASYGGFFALLGGVITETDDLSSDLGYQELVDQCVEEGAFDVPWSEQLAPASPVPSER